MHNHLSLEYLKVTKEELEKNPLENMRKTINKVVKAFREVFRDYAGMTTVEYRGKYGRDGVE